MWLSLTSFTAFSVSSIWLSFPCNSQRSLATHWIVWLGRFYHSTTRAIFQWTNLCCLGGIRTLHPSLDFHSQLFYHLNYKTSFCLEVIASPPHSTTLDYHGLPLWISKTQDISHYIPLNPCKIYFILSIFWIMMTVSVLSPVSTSYLVLDSK